MDRYHKIQTVWERDPATKFKALIEGKYACPEFEYLADKLWLCTEKIEGINIRVSWDGGRVEFRGRKHDSDFPGGLLNPLMEMFPKEKMESVFDVEYFSFSKNVVCLYGEGYGGKIERGDRYRLNCSFALFDVKINGLWLRQNDVLDIAKKLKIEIVPGIGQGKLLEMIELARCGFPSAWGNFPAEGIVARPVVELLARDGSRIITKVKTKDFRDE